MEEPQDERYYSTPPITVRRAFMNLLPFTEEVFTSELEEHYKDIKEFGDIPDSEREKVEMYTSGEVEELERRKVLWNRACSDGIAAPWNAECLEILLKMIDKACEFIDERLGELWSALKELEEEREVPMEDLIEHKMFLWMRPGLLEDKKSLQETKPTIQRILLSLHVMGEIGREAALEQLKGGE